MGTTKELFQRFFLNYFWIGIAIILSALLLDAMMYTSAARPLAFEILLSLTQTIGVSVLVASIFTFASGTSEFVSKLRLLLESIVIKRNFLGNIDTKGKKEALKALIQPSEIEKNKYPNIGDYYGYFINKTLDIGKKSVRSNYQVHCRAYLDPTTNRIAVDGMYNYRVYPSNDGFHDIVVGFDEDLSGSCKCHHIAINTPDGRRELHDNLKFELEDKSGDISKEAKVKTDKYNKYSHLDVELKMVEYGKDHWALISFKALQPTDGFRFTLHCEGDVKIQEKAIFVVGANYFVDMADDKSDLFITCNQWINEGSGLTVLVSIQHLSAESSCDG